MFWQHRLGTVSERGRFGTICKELALGDSRIGWDCNLVILEIDCHSESIDIEHILGCCMGLREAWNCCFP